MGSRIKEEERIEKAIRSLLKLSENRRCINCNSLGPQYVCTTFWTFVCINCSGIHREFTHRVKSISMAKFTPEEVSSLRAGGNERARQIYFKEWDTKRDAYPDSSNIFKLRDFIKNVYVENRFNSESNDKISLPKPPVIEDPRESNKTSPRIFGSRSLHRTSVDSSEIERSSGVGRSGNESLKFYFDVKKHKPKSRGLPKSPIRFEIVDDRFRDDGSVKRYDTRKDSRGSSKSLDLSTNKEMPTSPTVVRRASELVVDNAPHSRVTSIVKVEKEKDPVNNQMTRSLIDDDVSISEPSDENISKASSEVPASLKKTEEPPAPNSLEALLFGLSVVPETNNSELLSQNDISSAATPKTPDSLTSFVTSPTIAHAQSSGPTFHDSPGSLLTEEMAIIPIGTANNQVDSYTSPKGPSDTFVEESTLAITNYVHGVGSEYQHQDNTSSSIRKALPEDLFSGGFSFPSQQVHGQHHGMGYGMQYYQYPVNMGALTYPTKPTNPFDLRFDDTSQNQAPQFPSQSPFYTTAISPSSPSFASNLSPGVFIGHQPQVNMPLSFRRPEISGVGSEGNNYNAAHTFHQENNNGYPSSNPNAYISSGNPFE